jgi:hypothetical protein
MKTVVLTGTRTMYRVIDEETGITVSEFSICIADHTADHTDGPCSQPVKVLEGTHPSESELEAAKATEAGPNHVAAEIIRVVAAAHGLSLDGLLEALKDPFTDAPDYLRPHLKQAVKFLLAAQKGPRA